MQNYKITLQYDGTRYNGWQRQGNTDNTIQGKLNEIISRYLGEEVDIAGSGRTDAGCMHSHRLQISRLPNVLIRTSLWQK